MEMAKQNSKRKLLLKKQTERSGMKMSSIDTVANIKRAMSRKTNSHQTSSNENKIFDFNDANMVTGTQLKLNKNSLSFFTSVGQVSTCEIELTNIGTTAVYYEWQKCKSKVFHETSLTDTRQRFFCHHVILLFSSLEKERYSSRRKVNIYFLVLFNYHRNIF